MWKLPLVLIALLCGCSEGIKAVDMDSVLAISFGDLNSSIFEKVVSRTPAERNLQSEFTILKVKFELEETHSLNLVVLAYDASSGDQADWTYGSLGSRGSAHFPKVDSAPDLQYITDGEWRWQLGQIVRFYGWIYSSEEEKNVEMFDAVREIYTKADGSLGVRETDEIVSWKKHKWMP